MLITFNPVQQNRGLNRILKDRYNSWQFILYNGKIKIYKKQYNGGRNCLARYQ